MIRTLLVGLALGGCAAAPRATFPPIANMHNSTLCYVMIMGDEAEQLAARNSLSARGYDCRAEDLAQGASEFRAMVDAYHQMQAQERAQHARSSALIGLGLGILSNQPTYRPPIVCHTTPDRLTTICN